MDLSTFAKLSNTAATALAQELGAFQMGEVGTFVAEGMAKERKDAMKSAAADIIELMKQANVYLHERANAIVGYQEMIAAQEALTAQLTRALQFGVETQNFWPALAQMGYPTNQCSDRELLKVPKDWNPAANAPTSLDAMAGTATAE